MAHIYTYAHHTYHTWMAHIHHTHISHDAHHTYHTWMAHIHTRKQTRKYANTHPYTYICMHTRTHAHTQTHTYTRIHACTYAHTQTHTCTRKHTQTRTHANSKQTNKQMRVCRMQLPVGIRSGVSVMPRDSRPFLFFSYL